MKTKKATPAKKPAANKSVSQKLAIQRLNKARATLQKAVQAVNLANKKLADTMPKKQQAAKNKPAPRQNSAARKPNQRGASKARGRGKVTQNNRIERRPTQGGIKKRQQNRVANTNVAIKIRNKGPSGRGRGKASVIRDTLKKEKPATSLDDRFSQLLKSAKTKSRRGGATRGGRGGSTARGRGGNTRGRSNNQSTRGRRRY